jgi:tetratricopeptide (TPR) repeat protein
LEIDAAYSFIYFLDKKTGKIYFPAGDNDMLMSTGDQSPVIEAKGDVTVNYGLNEERVKAMLERQQEELFRKLRESGFAANEQERQLLEQQLQAVSAKLADIEKSYEEELARREAADAALARMQGQLPEAQIEKAQISLRQGDTAAAKSAFHAVLDKEGGTVALAAYQLGQMAESELEYAEAMRQYKKAAVLEEDKPEYLLAAGKMARKLAQYKQAQDWLEHLREIREAEGESAELGTALHELALLHKELGQYKEAEPLHLRAVAVKEKFLGKEHPDVAEALNDLAVLYWRVGKYTEAEPLYLRALAVKEKVFGEDHPSVAQTLNDLGLLYKNQERLAEAESLYLRSLAIREGQLGKDHLDVAESINNIAMLYEKQDRYSESEELYLRSIAIREAILGKKHPYVALLINNLAALYRQQNRYMEAEPLYLRTLSIREDALGKKHPDVAQSLNNLAALYRIQGKYTEAELLLLRALAIRENTFGKDHERVSITLRTMAKLYRDQGRYAEAEPLFQRALSIMKEKLPAGHSRISACQKEYDEMKQNMAEQSK